MFRWKNHDLIPIPKQTTKGTNRAIDTSTRYLPNDSQYACSGCPYKKGSPMRSIERRPPSHRMPSSSTVADILQRPASPPRFHVRSLQAHPGYRRSLSLLRILIIRSIACSSREPMQRYRRIVAIPELSAPRKPGQRASAARGQTCAMFPMGVIRPHRE
jgi:hypothetical protein